jgi:hypothetical protein
MPLGLLALHRACDRGSLRSGPGVGAAVALQALSSLYYGLFFAWFLVPVASVLAAGRRFRRAGTALLLGAALAGACLLPIVPPYVAARLLAWLPSSGAEWTRFGVAGLVAAAALVEVRPALTREEVWMRPPSVYGWFRGKPPPSSWRCRRRATRPAPSRR